MVKLKDETLMHNPPHVGEILREMYMEPLELTVTGLSERLGVSRQALSKLVNERSGISADMAIRLSLAFGTTAEFWVNLAKQYELWHAIQGFEDYDVMPYRQSKSSKKSSSRSKTH